LRRVLTTKGRKEEKKIGRILSTDEEDGKKTTVFLRGVC